MNSDQNHFAKYCHIESQLMIDGCEPDFQPDLSIMIPTFRRPYLLMEAIESIINQTEKDIKLEIVVVDNDAETECTELVNLIEDFLPNNIRLFRNKENIGMFGNWNRCIELARAPYLTILNDDDLLHPDFINQSLVHSNQTAICVGYIQFHAKNKLQWAVKNSNLTKALTRADFFNGNPIPGSLGFIFNKQSALLLGGYNQELWPTSDYDFNYRYFKSFGINKIIFPLAAYRWQENESMRLTTLEGFMTNDIKFRNKMIAETDCSPVRKLVLVILIKLMATSSAIDYGEINRDFKVVDSLVKSDVSKIFYKLLKFKYIYKIFSRLRYRICRLVTL